MYSGMYECTFNKKIILLLIRQWTSSSYFCGEKYIKMMSAMKAKRASEFERLQKSEKDFCCGVHKGVFLQQIN